MSCQNKRFFILGFLLLSLNSVFSKSINIEIIYTDGNKDIISLSENTTSWGFANSDTKRIKEVRNLDSLLHLENIEINSVRDIEDFSFLGKSISLKHLYIATCTLKNIKFLSQLINLESIYLDIYINKNSINTFASEKIDLSELHKLKFIALRTIPYMGVPPFIGIKGKPFLDFKNNQIKSITSDEKKSLSQYGIIDFRFTPIEKNFEIRKDFKKTQLLLDGDTLPAEYDQYYQSGK